MEPGPLPCQSGGRLAGPGTRRARWIDWILRHHRVVLLVAAIATIVAGWIASHLHVDSDLRRLLPRDHPVVEALEDIETTFGSTGSVNVVIKDGTVDERHAFVDAIASELEGHELLREVDDRLPADFFVEHALYYLTDDELAELRERIDAWVHYQAYTRNPDMFVGDPDPHAAQELEDFIEAKRQESLERTGFEEYYERDGIDATVVLLRPTQPAASLEFSKRVSQEMRAAVAEIYERADAPWADGSMTYNIVGPYTTKADEHRTIRGDTIRAGVVAVSGVVLVLFFLFRSVRAVLVLLVPLCCGVVWSLAATQLVLGHLNLMTSMISTVVMGAGIDAGIHFYVRAREERREHDDDEAVRRAFFGLIVPLLVASSTTIGAFLTMASSDFPAFREFGIISAMGVALCLLAMVTVLPALCHAVGIKRSEPRVKKTRGLLSRLLLARPGVVLLVIAVLTATTALGARDIEFEYNGRALQSDYARDNTEADTRLISRIFGKDIHAGILVRESLDEARATLERARKARVELGEASVVAELFAAPDLLPPASVDLAERQRAISSLLKPEQIEKLRAKAEGREYVPRQEEPSEPELGAADWADPDFDDGGEAWPSDDGNEDWADPDFDEDGEAWPEPGEASGAADWAEPDFGEDDEPWPESGETGDPADPSNASPEDSGNPADSEADVEELSADDAQALVTMLEAGPFGIDDLPRVLLAKVRAPGGEYGVFAYPAFDAANMRKGVEFTQETSGYLEGPGEIFVGETTVYAAMFLMLREEAPVVLGMALLLIAVLVYWQLRSLRMALMTLLPLGLALWWLVGVMGAIDLRFTLFNLPILPAILGIGVDNGVYLTDRIRRSTGVDGLVESLRETGSAIMAATATTAIGFAAFMVADSAGVRGIGAVAVLGIILAALAATLVLPALSGVVRVRRARR